MAHAGPWGADLRPGASVGHGRNVSDPFIDKESTVKASSRLKALCLVAGSVGACAVATPALGAMWTSTKYPTTSGSAAPAATSWQSHIAVATTTSGVPAVLYRANNKSIQVITKGTATAAWPSKATQWLSASAANAAPMLGAAVVGSRFAAMWTTGSGGSLRSAAGSRTVQSGTVTSRSINPPVSPVFSSAAGIGTLMVGPVSSGAAWYGISGAKADGSGARAFGGLMRAGQVPTTLLPFETNTGQAPIIAVGSDTTGNLTSLVRASTGPTSWAVRPASTSSWSDLTPLPVQPVSNSPLAVSVAPTGEAALAYVAPANADGTLSPTGTSFAVVWMTRDNINANWLGPWVVGVEQSPPWALGVALGGTGTNESAAVSWLRGPDSQHYTTPLTFMLSRNRYPGYPLPTATAIPLNLDPDTVSELNRGSLKMQMNPQGVAAVLWGSGGNQGTSTPLYATTSVPSGQWTSLVNLSGSRGCSGGYPGLSLSPYNTGFYAAWMCADSAPSSSVQANSIGVTQFR